MNKRAMLRYLWPVLVLGALAAVWALVSLDVRRAVRTQGPAGSERTPTTSEGTP